VITMVNPKTLEKLGFTNLGFPFKQMIVPPQFEKSYMPYVFLRAENGEVFLVDLVKSEVKQRIKSEAVQISKVEELQKFRVLSFIDKPA